MVRQTSIDCYHQIKEEGLLSERRMQVYEIIATFGPINCRQIIEIASRGSVTNTGSFSGRLSELESLGVIESHHEGKCPITGRQTIFWVITARLPITLERPKKVKCPHCKGLGHITTQQTRFNLDT